MRLLKNIAININSRVNEKSIVKNEINRLGTLNNDQARFLINAYSDLINNSFSEEEEGLITQIEQLRKRRLLNFQKINSQDFGNSEPSGETSLLSLDIISRATLSSKSRFWASLLFKIIRHSQPDACIELGTNMGISASYQASALKLNGKGRLITFEGSNSRSQLAVSNFKELDLNNVEVVTGLFQNTLEETLNKISPIQYAFIDGHHDERATVEYFNMILPHCDSRSVIIFDDIVWSEGMKQAWKIIQNNERVNLCSDLFVLGICVLK